MSDPQLDPRFLAGVQLLERTGARDFRIGYSDPDDGEPTVWYAVATWRRPRGTPAWRPIGGVTATAPQVAAEAAAALDGVTAVLRLCEQVIDGGECTHCRQRTIFVPDTNTELLDQLGCVYAWDPELSTFRRGCESDE